MRSFDVRLEVQRSRVLEQRQYLIQVQDVCQELPRLARRDASTVVALVMRRVIAVKPANRSMRGLAAIAAKRTTCHNSA